MEVTDLDDREIDQIEAIGHQFEEGLQNIETAFVWVKLFEDMLVILCTFRNHLGSIEEVLDHLPNQDDKRHRFLLGVLFGGVISAYEGMVHDFVKLLMNSDNYKNIQRLKNIDTNDLKRLRIKQSSTWEEVALGLQKTTLNHPNIVARILNSLFDFSVPEADKVVLKRMIQIRNDFTHNNGFNKKRKAHELSWEQLRELIVMIDKLVEKYVENVESHSECFLNKVRVC